MSNEIVLYDLERRDGRHCFSGNVWKTRLALNYKGLPYRTVWLTGPQIAPELKDKVPAPNAQGSPYTVPTVIFPDGTVVMESSAIARELEARYPSPSMHLSPELEAKVMPIIASIALPFRPVFMPRVARDVLVESTVDSFLAAREKMFGMPLFEVEKQQGGEVGWKNTEPGIHNLAAFIKDHQKDGGPFINGSQPCYMDLVILALLEGFRRIGQDLYDRIIATEECLGKFHEAGKPWIAKDR